MSSELIFYSGITIAAVSLIAGLVTAVVLSLRWKQLSSKLDAEYGKKGK